MSLSRNLLSVAASAALFFAPAVMHGQKPVPRKSAPKTSVAPPRNPKQKFALDVVRSAVAIPQPDSQDRLRVLVAASDVALPMQPSLAKQLSKEGLRLEQELIQAGNAPAASMLNTGAVDCPSVEALVENVPVARVNTAEQTLIGAITHCASVVPTVQRLESSALDNGTAAPRLALALMDSVGARSPWAQEQFEKIFNSLPSDTATAAQDAPNFATLYARMAPEVSVDVARSAGLKMLDWLAKLDANDSRNLAVNVTTGAMKDVLKENYDRALEGDVIARQVAQTAGQPGSVDTPPEENASVLAAIGGAGKDRTAELSDMPPTQRAREAAASGFANGTQGDKKLASRYFDVAFSSLNDVWNDRAQTGDASAIVQEVSEAAAQVNPVDALQRAQHLQDPTAQAIGMIAVARVVSSEQGTQQTAAR